MAKRNSEGVYLKIYKAASPFRSTAHRISHLPQVVSSVVTSDLKTKSPVSISSPQTIPVHSLHQTKMIPIEFDSQATPFKENNTGKLGKDSSDSEISVVKSHKFAKPVPRKQEPARPDKPRPVLQNEEAARNHVRFGKENSKENDDTEHENKFTAYIDKVKSRLMRAASQDGGAHDASTTRDSFNNTISN